MNGGIVGEESLGDRGANEAEWGISQAPHSNRKAGGSLLIPSSPLPTSISSPSLLLMVEGEMKAMGVFLPLIPS